MSRPVSRVRPAVEALDARVVLSTTRPFALPTATTARVVLIRGPYNPSALAKASAVVMPSGGPARAAAVLGARLASAADLASIARRVVPASSRAAAIPAASSVRVVRPAPVAALAATGGVASPAATAILPPVGLRSWLTR